jgi:Tfp pilus assembly protein FimT
MVVVGIIGIVSTMAVTNLAYKTPNQHSKNAIWKISADLRLARMQAISQNVNVVVTFDNDAESYTIWTDSNENGAQDTGEVLNRTLEEHTGANVWAFPNTATFTPQGNMTSTRSHWRIELTLANSSPFQRYIVVFENGQIDPEGRRIDTDETS